MTQSRWPAAISRERLRQLRANAVGRCSVASCKRKHVKNGRCKAHAAANRDAARDRYREGREMTQKCGKCQEIGHNRRRCGK
jgi:hypothetical protein